MSSSDESSKRRRDVCNTLDESITSVRQTYKDTLINKHITFGEMDDYFTVLSTLKKLWRDMECYFPNK